jgi:hypothetical protein
MEEVAAEFGAISEALVFSYFTGLPDLAGFAFLIVTP